MLDTEDKTVEGSLEAVTRRYLDLVYGSALRQMGDPHLAADVTQAVFLVLQKKWGTVAGKVVMGGWLLGVTRNACRDAKKLARRRGFHERRAAAMREEPVSASPSAEAVMLEGVDEALERLGEADRAALVLAYVEQVSHDEVGKRLGVNTGAAQKRVRRALERLRKLLTGRGATAAGVAAGLMAMGRAPAPAAVLESTLSALGGQPGAVSVALAKETMRMATMMKVKTAVAAAVAVGVMGGAGWLAIAPAAGQAGAPAVAAPAVVAQAGGVQAAAEGGQEVKEMTLQQDGANANFIGDLDSGRLGGRPQGLTSKFGLFNWAAAEGMDLLVENDGHPALFGLDMVALPVDNARFMEMNAQRLVFGVGIQAAGGMVAMSAHGELPVTYAIRTREGRIGMLQIVRVEGEKPTKITVRYRLLEPAVQARQSLVVAEELMTLVAGELVAVNEATGEAAEVRAAGELARSLKSLGALMRGSKVAAGVEQARRGAEVLAEGSGSEAVRKQARADVRTGWETGMLELQRKMGEAVLP